jgi:DNA-binding GntR family transcriptional regulator
MVSLSANRSAAFYSPNPKETQEAYEIRAVLEEVGARAAARVLRGNTSALQREIEGMHAAFSRFDLDSFAEHDAAFHRSILQASGTESYYVCGTAWPSTCGFEEQSATSHGIFST